MSGQRVTRGVVAVIVLLLTLWVTSRLVLDSAAGNSQGEGTLQVSKQVGAYFFYWWLFAPDPEIASPFNWIAFHPPGLLVEEDKCFHNPNPGPCISYKGGTYNSTYYNVNNQRFWEWQFRNMKEAGLDIAFMNSWDVVTMFNVSDPLSGWTLDDKTITRVKDYLVPGLDTIGDPLRIALYDDTFAEHHQWCLDKGYPVPACDKELGTYPMSLIESTNGYSNKDYFWYKWRYFYEAIPRRLWATHNGLPVGQNGRPLILMWHSYFFYDIDHSTETMCYLKDKFFEWTRQIYGEGVEPFLLSDVSWGRGGSDLTLASMCSSPHADWHAVDGWSYFGMAEDGDGAKVFRDDQIVPAYTTAYLGPGADHCAYSGPYGAVPNPTEGCTQVGENRRWWDKGKHEPIFTPGAGQDRQDLYYKKSWDSVSGDVNLVVIESWNELCEGTSVSRLETYIAPDLTWCMENGYNGNFSACPTYKAFTEDPGGTSGGVWTNRYWMRRTEDFVAHWKTGRPEPTPLPQPTTIEEDNNNSPPPTPECFDSEGRFCIDSGNWPAGSFDYNYCIDANYTINDPEGQVHWEPTIGPGVYDVYAWWQKDQGGGQDAAFGIYGQVESTIQVDQSRSQDAGFWNYLGMFPFAPGSGVKLFGEVTSGEVVLADSIRWIYRGPYEPISTPTPIPAPTSTPTPPVTFVPYSFISWLPHFSFPTPAGGPAATSTPLPTLGGSGYPPPYPPPPEPPTPWPTATPTPGEGVPPESSVDPLPGYRNDPTGFAAGWSGTDHGGSGIYLYDVQYRDGAGPWVDWLPRTSLHSWWFTPVQDAHTYYFRCRAHDRAGNLENWPTNPDYDALTTVDISSPTSQVTYLPSYSPGSFNVSWSGSDATSGIADYDVQVCPADCGMEANWSDWLTHTAQTSAAYSGSDGTTYSFRSRARDHAGNVEAYPDTADASTTVDAQPPDTTVEPLPLDNPQASFTVHWHGSDGGSGLDHYDIFYRDESAALWTLWLANLPPSQLQADFSGAAGHTYYFCSRGVDQVGNMEACPLNGAGFSEWPIQGDTETRVRPWSRVDALPAETTGRTVHVTWSGAPGSGVVYDVQVRDGFFGIWQNWKSSVTYTAADYTGQYGHIYCFRSRQKAGGTWEVYPFNYDTYTKLIDLTLGGGAPPAATEAIPPDEAPDRMEEVTYTETLGELVNGYIAPQGDVDWYRFQLTETIRLRVRLYELPADYDLYVFDGSGQFLWASTWGRRLPEEIVVRVPAGVYYVRLEGYAGAWSGEVSYQLLVERVAQ